MDRNGTAEEPDPARVRECVGDKVIIFKRGARWWAEWFEGRRQHRVSLKTPNRKRARQEAIRIEAALLEGTYKLPVKAPLLHDVSTQYLAYLAVEGRSAATLKRYRPELERIVTFAVEQGAHRISDVDVKLFDAYRAWRIKNKAKAVTVYHECILLKQVLNFAVRRELLSVHPLKNAKLKKPPKIVQPVFTLEQIEAILSHARPYWRNVFEFLACTGLRVGELCWLRWDDLDQEGGFVLVRRKPGWAPKDKDDRKVPINARLKALLVRLPKGTGWVFCGKACAQFPKGGQQFSPRRALSALKRLLKRHKLGEGKLHSFRHFFVSHCILSGVSPTVVADWVGHSSLDMVMKYFHLLTNQSREAMGKVSFQTGQTAGAAGESAVVQK